MKATHEQVIVEKIREAVAERRLRAGTKLREQMLSDIFGCNRAFVRRALLTLTADKIVELKPNRGAYIATPSPQSARDVFQARRAIERTVVRNVVRNASPADVKRLHENCDREEYIRASDERHEAIRMSGEFHLILGEIAGNEVLGGFLKELVLRSSLILGLYSPYGAGLCHDHDHRMIVRAIERGDEAEAIQLIDNHLRSIEASVRFDDDGETEDLRAILSV